MPLEHDGPQASRPSVLILSSKYDLTCDYVVARLREHGASYLRLNTEDLSSLAIHLYPAQRRCVVVAGDQKFDLEEDSLRSVFFRRPVFLRRVGSSPRTPEESFYRHQWSVFTRSMMIFESARWMNYPAATYLAEHKAVQLARAEAIGLMVPPTVMANNILSQDMSWLAPDGIVAIKSLDTVLVHDGDKETFGFTNLVDIQELRQSPLHLAPATVQRGLTTKTDLRVTVVGDSVFTASITQAGSGVDGDWRCLKGDVAHEEVVLPDDVREQCVALVKDLGLAFGALDFAVVDGEHYFLEINPTGEWAWLVDQPGFRIDEEIASWLAKD